MMLYIFILAHLLGDFVFQTAVVAEKKKEKFSWLFFHSFLYSLIFLVVFLLIIDLSSALFPFLCISLFHFFIDYAKEKIEKHYQSFSFFSFLIDQSLHLLTIFIIFFYFQLNKHGNEFYQFYSNVKFFHNAILYFLLFVIILFPSGVFIKKLFFFLSPAMEEEKQSENVKIGSIIGKLERIIIVIFVLQGQYEAIGLVLAAKSIARFNQMDNRDFAEKYLVGTLTSLLIALIAAMLIKGQLL